MNKRFKLRLGGLSIRASKRRVNLALKHYTEAKSALEQQRAEQLTLNKRIDNEINELQLRIEETHARIAQLEHQRLAAVASAAASASLPNAATPAAVAANQQAQPLRRMGDMLIDDGKITQDQLQTAIARQRRYGGRLGDILIDMGFIQPEDLNPYLGNQDKGRLGDILVSSGKITQEQLDKALAFQQKSGGLLGDVLLSLKMIEPGDLYRMIATQNNIGRIGQELSLDTPVRLPESVAREYEIVVIHQYVNRYLVAVSTPLSEEDASKIEALLQLPIEQVLATKDEMEYFWREVYGSEMLHESTRRLADEQPHNSAHTTFTRPQLGFTAVLGAVLVIGLIWSFWATLLIVNILIQLFYFTMSIFKFWIILLGSREGAQFRFTDEEIQAMDERELPIYTILVPMYKEAQVIPQLLTNLENLDYPKAKLDVRLLIEEDDTETRELLQSMDLPFYYTILVVPDSLPKTKPKACNYGLIRARGEYVVIYDAEDRPDPDQLKKVIATFRKCPEEFACIQAKLNYFNSTQNWLTRWFTQEYSMWFELLLPGIMRLDVPIPLGGTSNHFKLSVLKELNAWDPYNVTEDADLGIRLYKHGYKTAIVDSRTWEEANSRVGNWIRQRSRWIKGYMQTWLVHMRNPFKLWREIGAKGFMGFQVMILATPLLPLLNPFFWVMMILWFGWHFDFIPRFFPGTIYYLASVELYAGNFLFIFSNVAGVYWVIHELEQKRQQVFSYSLVRYALLTPIYWVMMSIAAVKAAWQLITKPFYWEKTVHGLHAPEEAELAELTGLPAEDSLIHQPGGKPGTPSM